MRRAEMGERKLSKYTEAAIRLDQDRITTEKIAEWLEGSLKVAHIWNQGGSRDGIMAKLARSIRNGDHDIRKGETEL
jgi:hypothetical protein